MSPLVAFGTSVFVLALLPRHDRHAEARPWLTAINSGKLRACCSAHTLAETFAALTCMPRMRVSPATAGAAIERIRSKVSVIAVTQEVAEVALRRCIGIGASSGAVYDAVHLAAAEAAQAAALVTLNPTDFERFRIETSPRIVVPPDSGGLL